MRSASWFHSWAMSMSVALTSGTTANCAARRHVAAWWRNSSGADTKLLPMYFDTVPNALGNTPVNLRFPERDHCRKLKAGQGVKWGRCRPQGRRVPSPQLRSISACWPHPYQGRASAIFAVTLLPFGGWCGQSNPLQIAFKPLLGPLFRRSFIKRPDQRDTICNLDVPSAY